MRALSARLRRRGMLGALVVAVACGCSAAVRPDLHRMYDRAARFHDVERNPVVVITGVYGSRLMDGPTGREVWGAFTGDCVDPRTSDGLALLALPMARGVPLGELRDGVEATGVLDRLDVDVLGLPVELDAYRYILEVLGAGGYRDETLGRSGAVDYGDDHFTCFQFAWDWRRDIPEAAAQFDAFLREKADDVERERRRRGISGERASPVRFDVVAHSMGGLLLRWYLAYGSADLPADGGLPSPSWEGASRIDRAIMVAPPNAGSLAALLHLTEGVDFGLFLPTLEPALLGTWPAAYQLLPRGRHAPVLRDGQPPRPLPDLLDVDLWDAMGWGLLDPDQAGVLARLLPRVASPTERRRIARDHVAKCLARARSVQAALDAPWRAPPGVSLDLFAGDAIETAAAALLDGRTGRLTVIGREPGDGTVTRASVLLDERVGSLWEPRLRSPIPWRRVTFLFPDHLHLTQDPSFADNVLFTLLEEPRPAAMRSE